MTSPDKTATLLVEAARWRLLGLLFERPRSGWHAEVGALAAEVDDAALAEAAAAAADVDEGKYLAALGPGGAASPREVAYRPMGDPGKILAALNGFYEGFGYRPPAEDPPDHAAVQIGFVGFLKLKKAYAAARGDEAAERTSRAAADTFIADHLAGFAPEFAGRLERTGLDYLARAGSILETRCAFARPRRKPLAKAGTQLTMLQDDDDPCFDCGPQ